jgi:uncharacterized membrane protein YcaP (DUF421 family)
MWEFFMDVDWAEMLLPTVSPLEMFFRGTVIYLGLFLILRLVLKRESGTVGITDLLVVVLLADAAQNAMAGDYKSISDGILLVSTIVFWAYLLNWLGFRFRPIQRLVHPPALPLINDGKMLKNNMRKEFITEDELQGMLREQGIEDLQQVKRAFMEGNGKISVITQEQDQHKPQETKAK